MDFKDFEFKLNNLNHTISDFLTSLENEEQIKIEEIFSILNDNLDIKKNLVETLESQMITNQIALEDKIKKIEDSIISLDLPSESNKHDIEKIKADLEIQKQEELKAFLFTQKKKKNDVLHKISNLKKELANFHRDNNFLLIEEEKNYKNRELELNRRLSIDIERTNEANMKEYIDLEKSLLEINDEKTITDIKKKINDIRMAGLKEIVSIKNKYALSIFENNLEYKKYHEKIILDNSLKTEEYKLKIKALEIEKIQIEEEEAYTLQIYNFENDKKIIQYEKENSLYLNQLNNDKTNQIIDLKDEIITINKKLKENNAKALKEIEKEAYEFDLFQIKTYKPLSNQLSKNYKVETDYLIQGLNSCIETYKINIILLLEKTYQNKKDLYYKFIKYLIINIKEKIANSSYKYKNIMVNLSKQSEIYFKEQKKHIEKLESSLHHLTTLLQNQISEIASLIEDYQKEEEQIENKFYLMINEQLNYGYQESLITTKDNQKNFSEQIKSDSRINKKEKTSKKEDFDANNLKIIQEYEHKYNQLESKIKQYIVDFKSYVEREKQTYKKFLKDNKLRINQLKKAYNENIYKHEKQLYKKYQDELEKNQLDQKVKISSL